MTCRLPLLALIVLVPATKPAPAGAQIPGYSSDQAASTAILLTPAGALPPLVRVRRRADSGSVADAAVRFGRYNFAGQSPSFSNLGATLAWHLPRRVQLGATVAHRSCDGCEGTTMGSVDAGVSLLHRDAAGEIGGDTDVGLQLSAGMGKARTSDIRARSVAVSVPVAVSLAQAENSLLTLFVAPSLAYGSLRSGSASDGTTRFMIAAGVGYAFTFGLGAHIAVHRVVVEDSPTQVGIALSWRFSAR